MNKFDHIREKREIEQSEARDAAGKIISTVAGLGEVYDRFTALVKPLHVKRKDEWLTKLMHDLRRREKDGLISLKALSENEEFNTIITKATLFAQQNHQKEKLEALRNVVSNTAVKISIQDIESDVIEHYLHLIERFSNLHFLLLKTFQNPGTITMGLEGNIKLSDTTNIRMLFSRIHPELNPRLDFIQLIWKDLYTQGLVSKETMQHSVSDGKVIRSLLTDFGEGLMNFIEEQE
jgi:hypothetical protein